MIVNAAGFDRVEPFLNNDDDRWTSLVAVNYLGPVRLSHAFLTRSSPPNALQRSSTSPATQAESEAWMKPVYSGTKGGLIAFTKLLARERARHRINVDCVCPGPTDTPLFATLPEKIRDGLVKSIPFRRLAKPEEVADAVVFFASSRSDFITGQALSVSGGLTMAGERWSTSSLPC